MRYVFRHRPISGSDDAERAAELAEYASETTGQFWNVHDALMKQGTTVHDGDFERIASDFELPPSDARDESSMASRRRRGSRRIFEAHSTAACWRRRPSSSTTVAMKGHGTRVRWPRPCWAHSDIDFTRRRWISFDGRPSAGLSLLLMSVLAVLLVNSRSAPRSSPGGTRVLDFNWADSAFTLPLLHWVNDGLLTIFFLVVGLEIKREFTVGRLATPRAAALPIVAAFGGMTAPALIYLFVVPPGPLHAGWGMTIATDTAFAVALIVLLGTRVPVELRVFLTAAVIMDDLVAIVVIAFVLHEATSTSPICSPRLP